MFPRWNKNARLIHFQQHMKEQRQQDQQPTQKELRKEDGARNLFSLFEKNESSASINYNSINSNKDESGEGNGKRESHLLMNMERRAYFWQKTDQA